MDPGPPAATRPTRHRVAAVLCVAWLVSLPAVGYAFGLTWMVVALGLGLIAGGVATLAFGSVRSAGSLIRFTHGESKVRVPTPVFVLLLGVGTTISGVHLNDRERSTSSSTDRPELRRSVEELANAPPSIVLQAAELAFKERDFQRAMDLAACPAVADRSMRDEIQYVTLMSRFHVLRLDKQRAGLAAKSDADALLASFDAILRDNPQSKHASTLEYFRGHVLRMFTADPAAAAAVFDGLIDRNPNSRWIQGCLYYSARLHYERGTPEERNLAVSRLRRLIEVDRTVKLVDEDCEVDSIGLASQVLDMWRDGIMAK